MPLDFPNSPSTNDTYSSGGRTWQYNGTSWILQSLVGVVGAGAVGTTELAANAVTSAKILDGTIVNADINASAAIALSKLATSSAGNIIVYNSSGVPTAVAETGDVTIDSSGVAAISSGVIVNADVNSSAAIALSKLASGTAGQVIVANESGVPAYTEQSLGYRNVVINGAMQIAQRGTSVASITSSGYRTQDRFITNLSIGTFTQTSENDAPTGSGFRKSLKLTCTTADASPAAGNLISVQQRIEGQNVQHFLKGTASAKQFTLSFWVKGTTTGTYVAELEDIDNSRTVSASYTINAANTWEKKTITFPADTTGAFDNDNNSSLWLTFWLGAGSTFSGGSSLQTTWGTTTNARAVGVTNLAGATNRSWQITGVQLEAGSVATPFEFEDYGTTLNKCLRYFWRNGKVLVNAYQTAGGNAAARVFLPVPMRTEPTLTQTGGASFSSNTSATTFIVDSNGSNEYQMNLYFGIGATTGEAYLYRTVDFGAEL